MYLRSKTHSALVVPRRRYQRGVGTPRNPLSLVALPGLGGCRNLAQHAHLRDGFISTDCNAEPGLHTTAQGTQRVFALSKFWNGGGTFEVGKPYCAVEKAAPALTFRYCCPTWLTRVCFSVYVSSADLTRRGCAARPC